jgi:hypothetical protein
MKIICDRGFYKFYSDSSYEVKVLENVFDDLVLQDDYLTFEILANLQDYSIKGLKYENLTAKKNYAGKVIDVLEANDFVYDFINKKLVNVKAITVSIGFFDMDTYTGFENIAMSGQWINKKQIKSYSGYIDIAGSGILTVEKISYYED